MTDEFSIAVIFQALSQSSRLDVVRLLSHHPDGLPGLEIAERLQVKYSTVAAQLNKLAGAGVTLKTRVGFDVHHRLKPGVGQFLIDYVKKGFSAPDD